MVFAIIAAVAVIVVALLLFWTVGLVAAAVAAVCMGISVTVIKLFILPRFEQRDKYRLATDNVRITPERLEVRYDSYKNGYVIDCFYTSPETGKKFVFQSETYPNDPTQMIADKRLTVVANRVDYSNYYIETDSLKDRL